MFGANGAVAASAVSLWSVLTTRRLISVAVMELGKLFFQPLRDLRLHKQRRWVEVRDDEFLAGRLRVVQAQDVLL